MTCRWEKEQKRLQQVLKAASQINESVFIGHRSLLREEMSFCPVYTVTCKTQKRFCH